jgi:hypothetical protein
MPGSGVNEVVAEFVEKLSALSERDLAGLKWNFEITYDKTFDVAHRHVEALLAAGCEHAVGDCDDTHCFYCHAWLEYDPHESDCAYIAAEAFRKALEGTDGAAEAKEGRS